MSVTRGRAPEELAGLREDYRKAALGMADAGTDPVVFFSKWFEEACTAGVHEPNAMTLATADAAGRPHARIVLLKSMERGHFTFFTNYHSDKGKQLLENPVAALLLFWPELEREVRIEGTVTGIDAAESDAYFHSRPRGSRLGAWASPQSQVVESRAALEENYKKAEAQFSGSDFIPRPEHWGGFAVEAQRIEFWQGRSSRMHDRILFEKTAEGWIKKRLAP